MPRVPHKKIKLIIQSARHAIRKCWVSVPRQQKCTVSWPRGYFKKKITRTEYDKKNSQVKNQKWPILQGC